MGQKRDGLPLGYPAQGALTSVTTPALLLCEAGGCASGVTCIVLHTIDPGDGNTYTHLRQLCDRHALEYEKALRMLYTVKPCTTIWRS
jgi:hypothetical protein